MRGSRSRDLFALAGFAGAYYVAYRYGMSFSRVSASPFWFPDSALLCALLLSQRRRWWIFVLVTLPIRVFSEVARDIPLWFLLTTFAIDAAKGVLTAMALRRFITDPTRFETLRDFALFCAWAVVLIPALSAFAGAGARHALGDDFWTAWERWFLGDALAHLVVTPAILFWIFGAPWKGWAPSTSRWIEGTVLVVGLVVTSSMAFDTPAGGGGITEPRFYAPVPFLFWAAIRFGMFGASGAVAVIAVLSVKAALMGRGPFSGQSAAATAVALQQFLLWRAAPLYLVAILIEQGKDAERSLRESQERMSLAATAADLWLWEWDIARDEIWLTNPGVESVPSTALVPINFAGFLNSIHPDDRADVSHALDKALGGNGAYESKYRVLVSRGAPRWVSSIGRVEFDGGQRAVRLRGVSRDITHTQLVEQQVQQQRDELAQLSRVAVLGELSGSVAHELNQPLTAILTNAQTAQRYLTQDRTDLNELREILGDIVEDDRRAAEIIWRLRQLFKGGEVQRETIDVNHLVRSVAKLAHHDLVSRGVDLTTELAPEAPAMSGDRVQLQQLLLNLITNACRAMADVAPADRRLMVRTQLRSGEGVRVTVTDRGRGIADDDLVRIFEPFFTTRPEGMGLGLAVCRTIIGVHGGKLWAENNADGGASFHFTLPAAEQAA